MKLGNKKGYSLKDYANKEVNLLPSDFHRGAQVRMGILVGIILIGILIGMFAYYEFTVYKDTQDLNNEIMLKKAVITANEQEIENQNIILSLGSRIQLKELLLDYIFSTNRSVVDILESFETTLNGEVYLDSLTANSTDSFVITATTTSYKSIVIFINKMKLLETEDGEKYFSIVFTNGITRNVDDDGVITYTFQLDCTFEGGITNEN